MKADAEGATEDTGDYGGSRGTPDTKSGPAPGAADGAANGAEDDTGGSEELDTVKGRKSGAGAAGVETGG